MIISPIIVCNHCKTRFSFMMDNDVHLKIIQTSEVETIVRMKDRLITCPICRNRNVYPETHADPIKTYAGPIKKPLENVNDQTSNGGSDSQS